MQSTKTTFPLKNVLQTMRMLKEFQVMFVEGLNERSFFSPVTFVILCSNKVQLC